MFKWLNKKKQAGKTSVPTGCVGILSAWRTSGQLDLLKQALERGCLGSTALPGETDTILHVAVSHGHLDALSILVAKGARDTVVNGEGQLALHGAALKGHKDCAQYLLKNMGSKIDLQDGSGNTALMLGVNGDHLQIVQLLLARGANALHARDSAGLSALHMCHSPGMLRCLHECTLTNIDTPDGQGQSPLMHMVQRCEASVIAEALACGADIGHIDHKKRNALHVACEQGQADMVPLLVKAGCSTTDADADGFTPVERALLLQCVHSSYALYCSGALFTKRQLLLLGVLLRQSSLLRALKEEQEKERSPGGHDSATLEGRLQRALAQPSHLSQLTVVPGPVPLDELNISSFQAAMQNLHDPVPRPVGSDASATLVAVFSRFLRHSMEPQRRHDELSAEAELQQRRSESGLPMIHSCNGASFSAPGAAHTATEAGGRSSLERMLPHLVNGGLVLSKPAIASSDDGASSLPRHRSAIPTLAHSPQLDSPVADVDMSAFYAGSGARRRRTQPMPRSSSESRGLRRRNSIDTRRSVWKRDGSSSETGGTGQGPWLTTIRAEQEGVDDLAVPRQSSSGVQLQEHGMDAFEAMMARRVALFSRNV